MPFIACGGEGIISVIGNAYPAIFSDMVRAALNGDAEKARELNDELLDIHSWLYVDGNPVGIKSALKIKGLCNNEVRLPLVPSQIANYNSLKQQMDLVKKKHLIY
jgi:4-hydroxy-tetrahydrodipicolinate synthase